MQARGNGPRKPHVGVLSPYLAGTYYGALISAITRVTALTGGRVAAIQTATPGREYHEGTTLKSLARVAWDRLDGFVTIANAVPATYLDELRAAGKPVVTIGNDEPGFPCPLVLTDNRGGVKKAVEHLLGHGHTRIAFAGCLEQFDMRERYESYRDTLVAHGIEPEDELLFEAVDNVQNGGHVAGKLMVEARLPSTAVVVATDLNAVGLMEALKEAGYVLPQDQAVVGFDDLPGSGLLSPSLSTVSQNFDDLGVLAAELLLRRLGGEPVAPGRYTVPATYVTRESCGCGGAEDAGGPASASTTRRPRTDPAQTFMDALGLTATEVAGNAVAARGAATKTTNQYGLPEEHSKHGGLEPRLAELVAQVHDNFQAAVSHEPTADQLLLIARACEEIYGHKPCQGTYDAVLELGNRFSVQLCEAAGDAAHAARGRLNQCMAQLRLGLTKALLDERNTAYYQLREAIRNEYDITLDLLNNQELDPRLLTWLERTKARMGVLAFWQERPSRGQRGR